MIPGVLSRTKSAFEIAAQFNRQLLQLRVDKLDAIRERMKASPGDSFTEDTSELQQKYRQQLYGILRARPDLERSLRAGHTPFRVPTFKDMNATQWSLLRLLAKSFGLLGPILPYDTEATRHVKVVYENGASGRRGNFILPHASMWNPKIEVRDCHPEKLYSFAIVDVDVPIEGTNRRYQLGLWGRLNVKPENSTLSVVPETVDYWKCIPPHPARGSDTHRIVTVVIEHDKPIEPSYLEAHQDINAAPEYLARLTDLHSLLGRENVKLLGYQFYRTCWTKPVSQFYTQIGMHPCINQMTFLGIAEPVFGELLAPRKARASKFANA